jgi:3-dehydroquinate synthase
VNAIYGDTIDKSMRAAGYATARFIFPHGEQSKTMETYISLLHAMAGANLSRSDVVVALGGGVTGDMAGFAAATYLRGIPFAQVPTTLLAMVDSSVGGKTAVDMPAGKNQVGAFYQPDIVICDINTLETLPDEIFSDGCAEVIKHGVILSAELFELLKQPIHQQLEDIIARNVTIKRDIVAADEKDTGIRQILNFGHTIGHGVEKHSGYALSHGKAVAIGMAIAGRGAYRMGLCGEDCYLEIIKMIERYQLPCKTVITPEQLIAAAFYDKKRSGQRISLILPEKIGKCVIKSFSMDDLAGFIRLGMKE